VGYVVIGFVLLGVVVASAIGVGVAISSRDDKDSRTPDTLEPGNVGGPTALTAVTVAPSPWETACPGPDVQVLYNVDGGGSGGTYTIGTPTGSVQGDIAWPLRNEAGGEGAWYCFNSANTWAAGIVAQNGDDYGSVRCTITIDGTVVAHNESPGAYVVVTCNPS
jgi:hypothetical protein